MTHHTSCAAICAHVAAKFCALEFCFESREQTWKVLRSLVQVATYPVDVGVRSSTRLPILVAGETAQQHRGNPNSAGARNLFR